MSSAPFPAVRTVSVAARLAAVSVIALLTLSGCARMPEAAELARADRHDAEVSDVDATAAFLEYVETINTALETGTLDDLVAATDPRCPCYALVDMIEEGTDRGGRFVGARFVANNVAVRSTGARTAVVRARVRVTGYAVHSPDGLVIERRRPERYVADYTLRTDGEQWRVTDVVPVR